MLRIKPAHRSRTLLLELKQVYQFFRFEVQPKGRVYKDLLQSRTDEEVYLYPILLVNHLLLLKLSRLTLQQHEIYQHGKSRKVRKDSWAQHNKSHFRIILYKVGIITHTCVLHKRIQSLSYEVVLDVKQTQGWELRNCPDKYRCLAYK